MANKVISAAATKILKESLRMKKGETLTIETWNTGLELAKELAKQARGAGCIPMTVFEDESAYVQGIKQAPKDVLGRMGKHEYGMLAGTDAYVFIPGPPLGAYYSRITREEHADATKYNNSWYEAAEKAKLRGVRLNFGYVGTDMARFLGKSPSDVRSSQLKGMSADFKSISSRGKSISRKLPDGAKATLRTEAGDLSFVLKGPTTVEDGIVDSDDVSAGENMAYLPPGMVTKDVDKGSATGAVALSPSLTRLGVAEGLRLEFKRGRLVSWSSRKPAPFVGTLLNAVKEENRVLSFLTVGLNDKVLYGNGIDRFAAGCVTLAGFGFVGVVRTGTLNVGSATVVSKGKL
jgi:aminopeptidase